ncbi:methyl-accepting chemotaxis protein [Cellvibrio sp. KY-GH-1]|uniref:methyl-accepting chemotaxis protein n=1 Tax=Cellvibrio sp. KY-GH-1 TaxID=2303332 RepID=UPI001247A778|nr:methyl-accepting chemotaxis protein [Cellvibrio sp. KY-GH-1]QEY16682.1 methyl-accepting chemotaxis protein [Cellvibrio sp. KY-GH-1]
MLRLTIAKKLMLLVTIALLGFAISQGYSQWVERANGKRLAEVERRLYPTLELTTVNLGSLLLMEQQINSSVTTGDEAALEHADKHYQEIRENLQKLAQLNKNMAPQVQEIDVLLQDWYGTATRIAKSFIGGSVDFEKVGVEAATNAEKLKSLRKLLSTMKEKTTEEFTRSISETVDSSRNAGRIALIIAACVVIALIGVSSVIGRSITSSINEVTASLKEMSSGEGDLTKRIHYKGHDEILYLVKYFNAFVEKLHSSFATVSGDVGGLATVASRLTNSSSQNLGRINEQARAISAMRTSIEELMKSVHEIAEFAGNASSQAQDASSAAARGKETLSANVATISTLAEEVRSAANVVNRFEEFSSDVGQLLNTIQTVAEQTNLLALNAAIEAARAGEHGRGFAVVADEVRGLAVRTRQATEEIHKVISELRSVSASAVTAMQGSVERANRGVEATAASGEVLNSILNNVETISSINEQIAAATQEQSATFAHVSEHVNGIYHNTQLVTASTNELDEVSRDIGDISEALRKIARQFRV